MGRRPKESPAALIASNGMVTFYVDGEEVGTQTRGEALDRPQVRFLFGDNHSSAGIGGSASDSYWATVKLQSGYHVFQIPGDANGDGVVDELDAQIVAGNWGTSTTYGALDADFDGDGIVGPADAAILAAHWGYGTSEATGVPEPSTLALLAAATILWIVRRRRQGVLGSTGRRRVFWSPSWPTATTSSICAQKDVVTPWPGVTASDAPPCRIERTGRWPRPLAAP